MPDHRDLDMSVVAWCFVAAFLKEGEYREPERAGARAVTDRHSEADESVRNPMS